MNSALLAVAGANRSVALLDKEGPIVAIEEDKLSRSWPTINPAAPLLPLLERTWAYGIAAGESRLAVRRDSLIGDPPGDQAKTRQGDAEKRNARGFGNAGSGTGDYEVVNKVYRLSGHVVHDH